MDYYSNGGAMGIGHHHQHAFYSASMDPMKCSTVDDTGLDFLFNPHGIWPPPDAYFQPASYSSGISDMAQLSVYDASATYPAQEVRSPSPKPVAREENLQPVVESSTQTAGPKRKRSTGRGQGSRKQQKTKREDVQESSPPSDGTSSVPSVRAHYAVEKRYRSTLNERYATLARLLSHHDTQEICRTECEGWEVPSKLEESQSPGEREGPAPKRQSKTTTLSVAIDTIALLDKCCTRKAIEYQSLVKHLNAILQATPVGAAVL